MQECEAGRTMLDVIFKPWVSGEEISTRPNYGRDTINYDWKSSSLFWELNKELFWLLLFAAGV